MKLRTWAIAAALAVAPVAAAAQGLPCSTLAPLARSASWQALHQIYVKQPCDDGAIAEAFSDFVVHKLASAWASLSSLASIVRGDSGFGTFVIRHIDATADDNELRTVARLASTRCPRGSQMLCRRIGAAASRAASEAAQPN